MGATVGAGVAVAVGSGLVVGSGVAVGSGVPFGPAVPVGSGLVVGSGLAVGSGVDPVVAALAIVRMSLGPLPVSRLAYQAPFVLVPTMARLTFAPDFNPSSLTGTVTQPPGRPVEPIRPTTALSTVGFLVQVTLPSDHDPLTTWITPPLLLPSRTNSRSCTDFTLPGSSGSVNLSSVRWLSPAFARLRNLIPSP